MQPELLQPRPERPLVSLVCPVFREEASIDEFHRRATAALEAIAPAVDHELIFVNDGSDDRSGELLREICARDDRCRLVDLSRNFGHQLAITAGIDHARGDAVVLIDTDLQDPPEVIQTMVASWRQGWDVVYGQRVERLGESRARMAITNAFYAIVARLSDTHLPRNVGDFRLMDRAVCDALRGMREENRYLRGLVAWLGFQQTVARFTRDPRHAGVSNYTPRKLLRLAFAGLTAFSERPLRLASMLGVVITMLATLLAAIVVIGKVVDPSRAIQGYTSLMVVVLLLGGVQLLALGLIGEYLGRAYRETKRRPLYVVRHRVGFDAASGGAGPERAPLAADAPGP